TIMDEASEFLERLQQKDEQKLPMFTSCCPGWVRFLKSQYPDMVPHLSTSKSPHQMFGAITKTWFAEKLGVDPAKLYNISVMP
ncbi:iron hydrogenase, partial [Desulfovibrio desulfuricans]|nr:iron hydrogenase [Desulfovibrio desulfuricans]